MKNNIVIFLVLSCLGFFCADALAAQGAAPAQQAPVIETAKECPEADIVERQIRTERNEIKAIENKMKALGREQKAQRDAQRDRKMGEKRIQIEGLKQTDPQKYEQEMSRLFERQQKREADRKQKLQEGTSQPKMTHEQWLAKIKTNNPQMYDLAIKKDALGKEIQALRIRLQDARKACMPNK